MAVPEVPPGMSEAVFVANPTRPEPGGGALDWSSVVKLDPGDLSIVASAQLAPDAVRLAIDPEGSQLWVSHQNASKISILDPAGLGVIEESAEENMLNHQNNLAQVKSGISFRSDSQTLVPLTSRFDCFQKRCSE